MHNDLGAVAEGDGDFAGHAVVDQLAGSGSHVGAAAGQEVGQAHGGAAFVDFVSVVQAGGQALEVALALVSGVAVKGSKLVAHV